MDIAGHSTITSELQASQPLARPTQPTPAALREACRQFEAIFIRQMLDQSLAPLLAKPDGETAGSSVHRHMISDTLANQLSQSETFGIADLLQLHFQHQAAVQQPETTVISDQS